MSVSHKSVEKYHKEKTTLLQIRLIRSTDAEIIKKLASVPNKSGYIKELIRQDMKRGN